MSLLLLLFVSVMLLLFLLFLFLFLVYLLVYCPTFFTCLYLFVWIPQALQYDGTSNFGQSSLRIFCFSVTYDCLKCLWLMFCLDIYSKPYQSRHHPNFPVWKYILEFNLHKMFFSEVVSGLMKLFIVYFQLTVCLPFIPPGGNQYYIHYLVISGHQYLIILIVLPSEA
jgi:hypothetical protein